jgi:hypothetical protein
MDSTEDRRRVLIIGDEQNTELLLNYIFNAASEQHPKGTRKNNNVTKNKHSAIPSQRDNKIYKYSGEFDGLKIDFFENVGPINLVELSRSMNENIKYELVIRVLEKGVKSKFNDYDKIVNYICYKIPKIVVIFGEDDSMIWLKENKPSLRKLHKTKHIVGPSDLTNYDNGHVRRIIIKLLKKIGNSNSLTPAPFLIQCDYLCLRHEASGKYMRCKSRFWNYSRCVLDENPNLHMVRGEHNIYGAGSLINSDEIMIYGQGETLCAKGRNKVCYDGNNADHPRSNRLFSIRQVNVQPTSYIKTSNTKTSNSIVGPKIYIQAYNGNYLAAAENGRIVLSAEPDEWKFVPHTTIRIHHQYGN